MCVSRLYEVIETEGPHSIRAADADGRHVRLSLLAYEGQPPEPGGWIVAHSGYALGPADPDEAAAVVRDLQAARHGPGRCPCER